MSPSTTTNRLTQMCIFNATVVDLRTFHPRVHLYNFVCINIIDKNDSKNVVFEDQIISL